MENTFKIKYGKPYPLGATIVGERKINFAVVMNTEENCGVVLYNKNTKREYRLSFCCSNRVGNVRCMMVEDIDAECYDYNFYIGDSIITDPYSKLILGNDKWGKFPERLRSKLVLDEYDWGDDSHPLIPYNNSIFYLLHVRGFTKHKSSNVVNPGTFDGVAEKIPYLKDLGVTTLELMPVYNFVEMEKKELQEGEFSVEPFENNEPKLNYWGYKESFYFAPKGTYAPKGVSADVAFKNLVRKLHKEKMEVIVQFFFPDTVKQGYIFEVLKYWLTEYHVDGFHLMGNNIPISYICTEPMLTNTKILYEGFPIHEIYEHNVIPSYKNLAVSRDTFMYDLRKFIKSDEGMVPAVLDYMKNVSNKTGEVHYITHGNSFTLMDLVCYDKKHNEDNGENNRDGSPYNGSWNCGYEGPTKKKSIEKLRLKQIKNAITLNMLAKSTPLIVAGDEFGNSQKGNNNPYCHDSLITWINWGDLEKHKEIFDYMKFMISFRMNHEILHTECSFMMSDYIQCGYPDLSLHSEEPWKVDADPLSRQFGLLYAEEFASNQVANKSFIYVAVNMHWTNHEFAIPKLPNGTKWEVVANTEEAKYSPIDKENPNKLNVKERSIVIMRGVKKCK